MKNFFLYAFAAIFLFAIPALKAQVAINTDGSSPNPAAMLDVKSTGKGFLPPRMTAAEMNAIAAPPTGLIIYNLTVNSLYWFDGTLWKRFNETSFTGTVTSIEVSAPLTGGTITTSGTIGIPQATSLAAGYLTSTDWNRFNSKVSSQWTTAGNDIYFNTGEVGIGITNPSSPLHVVSDQSVLGSSVALVNNTYTGTNPWVYAVQGRVNSTSTIADGPGIGVLGLSNNPVGGGVGVFAQSNGSEGYGLRALANSASGVNYGVYARTLSPDGYAGYFYGGKNYFSGDVGIGEPDPISPLHIVSAQAGVASSVVLVHNTYSGTNPWIYAIKGQVNSSSTGAAGPGLGVLGVSGNAVGGGVGVFGQSNGSTGMGIKALGNSTTGINYGLYAGTLSDDGYGGFLSGGKYALYAVTTNPDGYAGYFTGPRNYFSGSVGIGTNSPAGKLHVNDAASSNTTVLITPKAISAGDSSTLLFGEDNDGTYGMYWMYDGTGNLMGLWGKYGSTNYGPHLLVNRDNGSMAIGSNFATGYKLSVSGKIICTELRVNLVADWPDYVFKKEYNLLPVERLGDYIRDHGHLPNIPPASEINTSGLDVGEMQRLMMEKIEELSLYIVGQQKQIEELKKQLNNGR